MVVFPFPPQFSLGYEVDLPFCKFPPRAADLFWVIGQDRTALASLWELSSSFVAGQKQVPFLSSTGCFMALFGIPWWFIFGCSAGVRRRQLCFCSGSMTSSLIYLQPPLIL